LAGLNLRRDKMFIFKRIEGKVLVYLNGKLSGTIMDETLVYRHLELDDESKSVLSTLLGADVTKGFAPLPTDFEWVLVSDRLWWKGIGVDEQGIYVVEPCLPHLHS
jgi:hypothetical protein